MSCWRSCRGPGGCPSRQLAGDRRERLQVIVRFLALLELYKRGLVDLDQASPNEPLEVWWLADDERTAGVEAFDVEEYQG